MRVRNHVDLVEKTLRVLEALGKNREGTNLRTIAAESGLVKSSTFRILFTLKELGYAGQSGANGVYHLSPKILALARQVTATASLLEIARPHLVRLRDAVWESVWLGQLREGRVILADVADAPHALHLRYGVGDRCPMHATALGKAIAAFLPPRELRCALGEGRLRRFTSHTISRRSRLLKVLERVRQNGFAVNDEETTEGAIILGSPIFDSEKRVFAAISISVPTVRCSPEKRKKVIDHVKKTSAVLTAELQTLRFRSPEVEMGAGRRRLAAG